MAGNIDPEVSRQEVLTEIATSVGQTFLGLTVNCARCHNHKFDPILQADYYRLEAVFAGAKGKEIEIATPQQKAAWTVADKAYKERLKPMQDALKKLPEPYEERLIAERLAKLDQKLQEAWHTPEDKRTPEQKTLAKNAKDQIEPTWDVVVAAMTPEDRKSAPSCATRLHEVESTEPDPLPTAYGYVNYERPAAAEFRACAWATRHNRLDPVEPAVPTVLKACYEIPKASTRDGAPRWPNWLAHPNNPLTARVMVNRIWQFRMGQGIVRTPNDFGVMGDRPPTRNCWTGWRRSS